MRVVTAIFLATILISGKAFSCALEVQISRTIVKANAAALIYKPMAQVLWSPERLHNLQLLYKILDVRFENAALLMNEPDTFRILAGLSETNFWNVFPQLQYDLGFVVEPFGTAELKVARGTNHFFEPEVDHYTLWVRLSPGDWPKGEGTDAEKLQKYLDAHSQTDRMAWVESAELDLNLAHRGQLFAKAKVRVVGHPRP